MRIYSLKSSKYGISCTQIYYVISWKRYFYVIVYGEIGQRHKDYSTMTWGGLGLQ
jgi:hypothetical protein